jgi:hypothetical protein
MKQSLSRVANRFSASQEIPRTYGKGSFIALLQVPTACPYPEADLSSSYPHIPLPDDPS